MTILAEVIESIFPIFIIILIGYLLENAHWFDERFSGNISKLIMKVALPASIFSSVISHLHSSQLIEFADGIVVAGIAVIISYVAAFILARIMNVRSGKRGTFINTFANANTIFIGMPLNMALFGDEAEAYFLIYYVINTISTWAFGAFLITNDPTEVNVNTRQHHGGSLKQVLSPPLIAFILAFMLVFLKASVPSPIITTTQYLGNLVTPLALIYIGIVLCDAGIKSLKMDKDTLVALIGKFVIAPAAMILVIHIVQKTGYLMPKAEVDTFIMQSAVPALTVLPVLANEGKGDVRFATNIVAFSTIIFIVVAPLVMFVMQTT